MRAAGQGTPKPPIRFRFPVWGIVPVAVSALLGVFLWSLLHPAPDLPSALIGRPVPQFALPPITGMAEGFSTVDLKGRVALVNIFASWCVPCRADRVPSDYRALTPSTSRCHGLRSHSAIGFPIARRR